MNETEPALASGVLLHLECAVQVLHGEGPDHLKLFVENLEQQIIIGDGTGYAPLLRIYRRTKGADGAVFSMNTINPRITTEGK